MANIWPRLRKVSGEKKGVRPVRWQVDEIKEYQGDVLKAQVKAGKEAGGASPPHGKG
jgi:hypothetical protein